MARHPARTIRRTVCLRRGGVDGSAARRVPFAIIREDEGVTLILTRANANRVGLAYEYIAARITLRVGSALTDVGLTALFSRTLAAAGISCNVIAGLAHDHLFVDWDQNDPGAGLAAQAMNPFPDHQAASWDKEYGGGLSRGEATRPFVPDILAAARGARLSHGL